MCRQPCQQQGSREVHEVSYCPGPELWYVHRTEAILTKLRNATAHETQSFSSEGSCISH